MSNTKSYSNSYKEAGVDVTAGYRSVELIKKHVWWFRRSVRAGFFRHEDADAGFRH